ACVARDKDELVQLLAQWLGQGSAAGLSQIYVSDLDGEEGPDGPAPTQSRQGPDGPKSAHTDDPISTPTPRTVPVHLSHQRGEQPSLKRYGNQCIQACETAVSGDGDYLEQLAAIAALYVQGYELEYARLFAGDHYSRISLPTYPFARDRYWVPGGVEGLRPAP